MQTAAPLIVRALVAAVPLVGLSSCRACGDGHPFVPYRIDAGEGTVVTRTDAAPAAVDAATFRTDAAEVAPPRTTRWELGKLTLAAPEGAEFRQGLSFDADGDGRDDAVTIVERGGDVLEEALIVFHGIDGGVAAGVEVPLGVRVPVGVGDVACTRREHLARVGRRSIAFEVGEVCPLPASAPRRVVGLLAWTDAARLRLALPVLDPPGATTLALDVDGADLDGDGLDDVTLRVTLDGGEPPFEPGPTVHAMFRWFDRPAGLSREPGEPERSFHAIAALAASRAAKPKEAGSGAALAAAGRMLFGVTCAESASRRISPGAEAGPLACESGKALEELGLAGVRAAVTAGDSLRALAALEASGVAPATRTPARQSEAAGWLAAGTPTVQASQVRAITAIPRVGGVASWGALRFEPSGTLLVRTLTGVARVDPVTGGESDATEAPWAEAVVTAGRTFAGAFARCGSLALEATLVASDTARPEPRDDDAGAAVASGPDLPLPVLAPFGRRCRPGDREPVRALPLASGAGGLEVLVEGEPVLIDPGGLRATPLAQLLGTPTNAGSPRSPDGGTLVVPTSLGLLVKGGRARLLRAKELEHGYGELRDCSVSDDAARVACVRGGVAFVGIWPLP